MGRSVPAHVGIIMDGNGRWARQRGLPRNEGHKAAERAIHDVVEACGEIGVGYLTLYAFSTENWNRPRAEVDFILSHLLAGFIKRNIDELDARGVRIRTIGRTTGLPSRGRKALLDAIERTRANSGLQLILALNYGGRAEIADAVRTIAQAVAAGRLEPGAVDEAVISGALYLPDVPDPDLIIRTSGEERLSNFLLWQSAYSELCFSSVLWPDYTREDLEKAISGYMGRERRFGGVDTGGGPA
ncbi:isoprenyl transferase [Candidatus Fermentibacterales bacterium]|nr:isoprenyl transferase [Candidatus Fermentibacterales bacterium]